MSAPPIPRVTPEEYLAADRAAAFKSEYYEGYVYAMAGDTPVHAQLKGNVATELNRALGDRPCIVLTADARLCIAKLGPYVYPDVMVVGGPIQSDDEQMDNVVNPTVIVEVLSKTTEAHDRGAKFGYYRRIASFRESMLVSQTAARVEVFERQANGKWELSEYAGLDAIFRLDSIDSEIRWAGIYNKVTLPPEDIPPLL